MDQPIEGGLGCAPLQHAQITGDGGVLAAPQFAHFGAHFLNQRLVGKQPQLIQGPLELDVLGA